MTDSPLVSVLVCTSNRLGNVGHTARSVQKCGYPSFELVILDQSKDDQTEQAVVEHFASDARIRYVRLPRPNKPEALNHGRSLARGRYVLLTDDDCEVHAGWIDGMVRMFEKDSRVGVIFGDVDGGPHDEKLGYIPICRVTEERVVFGIDQLLTMPGWGNFGMGASLGLSKVALDTIGGWDPCIGPGARFRSGDDHDVVARVLLAGFGLGFTPASRATHYGFRPWDKFTEDQVRYAFGLGAALAKQSRCGTYYPGPLRVLRFGVERSARNLVSGVRPLALAHPLSLMKGFWAGLTQPLDRKKRCYTPDSRDFRQQVAAVVPRPALQHEAVAASGPEVRAGEPPAAT